MAQVLRNAAGSTYELPPTLFIRGLNRPTPAQLAELDGEDVIVRPPVRRAATGTLAGTLVGSSYADAQQKLDQLLEFVQHAPLRLHLHGPTSRYLVVWPEGVSDETTVVARAAHVSVSLVAPDPLWVGLPQTFARDVAAAPASFSVTNAGNAPTQPVIRLIGRSAGGEVTRMPSLSNASTGRELAYGSLLSQGQVLHLNTATRSATQGSEGRLNEMNTDYLVHGFPLNPGVNSLTVNLTNPTAGVRVEIEWNERWL